MSFPHDFSLFFLPEFDARMIKKKSQIMKIDTDPKQRSKNFPVVLHLDVVPVPLFLKPDIVNLMEKKTFFY